MLQCVAVYCSVLQCAAYSCVNVKYNDRAARCAAVCCSMLQCVTVCCSVLQCAVCELRESFSSCCCVVCAVSCAGCIIVLAFSFVAHINTRTHKRKIHVCLQGGEDS